MKKITLLITFMLFAYSFNLLAQEKVTFTWTGGNNKRFGVQTDTEETFTIAWGDGSTTTPTGNIWNMTECSHNYANNDVYTVTVTANSTASFIRLSFDAQNYGSGITSLDVSECPYLKELHCNGTLLTALDVSKNSALIRLYCNNSQISTLNINGAAGLTELICNGNKIKTLDLSTNLNLTKLGINQNLLTNIDVSDLPLSEINVMDNRLLLSHLWSICSVVPYEYPRRLGVQTRPVQNVGIGYVVDFSKETVFGGSATVFTVTKDELPVTAGTDYTVNNGKFTFLQEGTYDITMTNSRITGNQRMPTVIATFKVEPTGTEASLSNLAVSEGELTPTFDAHVVTYAVNVENETDSMTITATTAVTGATIAGVGKFPLCIGGNDFTITVTAADGSTKLDYLLTVTRAGIYHPNTNATLSSLTVNPGTLDPAFYHATLAYTVNVGQETDSITIAATASSDKATVTGTGKFGLALGNNNVFTVTVTAEDGVNNNQYRITVTRGTGIASLEKQGVEVYPNPTSGQLRITNYELRMGNVEIYDVTGRKQRAESRKGENEMVIDISNLPAGIYFVQIGKQTTKIVKE